MNEDLGRYESAVGWNPDDPFKKLRDKVRAKQEIEDRQSQSILHSPHCDDFKPAENVFTTLWRTGEVALLYGAPGVGKSIFAVRLAEAIGGSPDTPVGISEANLPKPPARRAVYIDLQRTESQFHQRFPNITIERRHFDWNSFDADENDSIRAARMHSSIYEAIEDGAEAVILDDITMGGINIGRPQGPLRTLRTMKMFAAKFGTSFLVIAGARPQKRPRAAMLSDVAYRHIAEQADSVFCLAASTYGPAFRYIRHLRSASAPIIHDASKVLTFQIGSPPYESGVPARASRSGVDVGGVDDASADGVVLTCPEFKYLGECDESENVRDYTAEALRAKREKERERKRASNRSNKDFLIDGMMDGSYARYLKAK